MKEKQFVFFGIETGRIYASGTSEVCHRQLMARFPSFDLRRKRAGIPPKIYPEPLRKVGLDDN